jgi:hypothetical protein
MLNGTTAFLKLNFMSTFITISALVMVVSAICAFTREMNTRWILGMGALVAFVIVFFYVSGGNYGLVPGFLVALVVAPFFILFFVPLLWYELYIITRWEWSWLIRTGCLLAPFICGITLIEMNYSEKIRVKEKESAERVASRDYFHKKCAEDSGYFLYKEVETPQESVFIIKPIDNSSLDKLPEQFRMNDPYSEGSLNKPELFLGEKDYSYSSGKLLVSSSVYYETLKSPFDFVEMRDTETKKLWRYTLKPTGRMAELGKQDENLQEVKYPELKVGSDAIMSVQSRYGITWNDLSTLEDRQLWVAKSRLQIIELQTNEVVAERIGYVSGGSRAYWPSRYRNNEKESHHCPIKKDSMVDVEWIASVLRKTPFPQQEEK